MAEIFIIAEGYSKSYENTMEANCSCTFIKSNHNIIVDTMTAWDSEHILTELSKLNVHPNDVNWVINTHGHSDHLGNNNLFLNAKHITGFSISHKNTYFDHPFSEGKDYVINDNVTVIPTPGHTLTDVTVIVKSQNFGTVAVTGDLFEREEDIKDPSLWKIVAGSEAPDTQNINRNKIAQMVDWIIPGHGPMFKVTEQVRKSLLAKSV